MPRRVQDILPSEHRSIRDIPLHKEDKRSVLRRLPITPPPSLIEREKITERETEKRPSRIKWLLIALGIVVVISGFAYVASSYYSRATFTIVPKVLDVTVNGTYVAQATPGDGVLSYNLVTLSRTASTTVAATDGQVISTKAQGSVVLYNYFSTQAVRLIAGTRLSMDGVHIYRLPNSISIPGYKNPSGTIIPGTLKVTIVADAAGQDYNISKSDSVQDFKIVAYKGTARYEKVYGKISTDIAGGWNGTKKTVSPTILASSTASLKNQLTKNLLSEIKTSIPEGYILYDGLQVSSFTQPVVSGNAKNSAVVTVSGTVTAILFKASELVDKFSGNKADTTFGKLGYSDPKLDKIEISIANLKDFSPQKKGALILKAKGQLALVGNIPIAEITQKLQGLSSAESKTLLSQYNSVIESASGEIAPPWAKIPTNPDRIRITVEKP